MRLGLLKRLRSQLQAEDEDERDPDACPGCGAPKEQRLRGFGKRAKTTCNRCAHVFEEE